MRSGPKKDYVVGGFALLFLAACLAAWLAGIWWFDVRWIWLSLAFFVAAIFCIAWSIALDRRYAKRHEANE